MTQQKDFKKLVLILIGMAVITGAGCSHLSSKIRPESTAHQGSSNLKPQPLSNWSLTGAISITYGKQREMARFSWLQQESDYIIHIFGPLNLKNYQIIGSRDYVQLISPDKKSLTAKTPEELIYKQSGWRLPISNLRYWLFAKHAPHHKYHQSIANLIQNKKLITLNQQGWQIKCYDFYSLPRTNLTLPRIIELNQDKIFIKIKISRLDLD